MKIQLELMSGEKIALECGTFTYQACPGTEAGPMMVTLLEKADRKAEDNEPIAIFSRVASYRVLDKAKEVGETTAEPAN